MMNYDVFYLTEMLDEHGQRSSKKQKKLDFATNPRRWDGRWSEELWQLLDISYDTLIRTTDDYHEKVVAQVFERLLAQDDIYLGDTLVGIQSLMKSSLQKANWLRSSVMRIVD